MRDIIFGDTNSGINRIVQVFLIAVAIALGTGVAWRLSNALWGMPVNSPAISHNSIIQCIASFIGCTGFFILFNIHGPGGFLCALGGALAWATYCIATYFGATPMVGYFVASITAATYAEIMARIRKYPAISYLVISIFPLLPGGGIYFATNHLVQGNLTEFAEQTRNAIAIAGIIAVGILVVSTVVRLIHNFKHR